MSLSALPSAAAWRHRDARMGFEVVYFQTLDEGYRIDGYTTAIEDGEIWMVNYTIRIDTTWTTRRAQITGRSTCGLRQTVLEADGAGQWLVDGEVAPHLDGCLDVDLESSAMTNALPVRRMGLQVGDQAAAPAAYVGASTLRWNDSSKTTSAPRTSPPTSATTTRLRRSTSRASSSTTSAVSCWTTPGSPSAQVDGVGAGLRARARCLAGAARASSSSRAETASARRHHACERTHATRGAGKPPHEPRSVCAAR